MKCKNCKGEIRSLKRRYFSKKLRCPRCNSVISNDFPVDWKQIKTDLGIMFGLIQQIN